MAQRCLPTLLAVCIVLTSQSIALGAGIETQHLFVSAAAGVETGPKLETFAANTQALFQRILEFWSIDADIERQGKVRVILDLPKNNASSSIFYWSSEGAESVRNVRVFGSPASPQMLAHKLTSALFPQKDKLLRNMMGVLTEQQLGNGATFPMCGFSTDTWVLAFLRAGIYLPLAELGADHEAWGMSYTGGGKVQVLDRAKQHRAYAEAGSFAQYLHQTYSLDALLKLQKLSQSRERPMREVFGLSLQELEKQWLDYLKGKASASQEEVDTLARLFVANSARACFEAHKVAPVAP